MKRNARLRFLNPIHPKIKHGNDFRKCALPIFIAALWIFQGSAAFAGIRNSLHDFTAQGWTDQICLPCHTPHNARLEPEAPADSPLWNHDVTTSTFDLYQSTTLEATVEQPDGPSKLCLSCHDGTLALDAYGGGMGTGGVIPGVPGQPGSRNLGVDLRDDHPVSFRWEHQSIISCTVACHDMHSNPYAYSLKFYNHRVECSTCHDPHANSPAEYTMLRMTNDDSALCLLCHNGK